MEKWIQQFWTELEQLGEKEVRVRLANKSYFDSGREGLAREWLQQKEIARAAELERRRAEREAAQVEVSARALAAAKAAADAAERSARAAEKPNTRAVIAIMIAATALIVSMLSLVGHFFK
jgi:hypothetical protein